MNILRYFHYFRCFLPLILLTLVPAPSAFTAQNSENTEITIDFNASDVREAVRTCRDARVEGETLFVDIPKEAGMRTRMISIPLDAHLAALRGHFLEVEADVCFSDVLQPKEKYFGVKFQFHMKGTSGNEWPGVMNRPNNTPGWGTLDWFHSKMQCECSEKVESLTLELGLQSTSGHYAIKNIVIRKGRPCPVSTLSLAEIPRAEYTSDPLPRMRGVMSPNTSNGPREEDFAEIAKWGANLIRWQMGLGNIHDAQELRAALDGRLEQLDSVLELAKKYHLYVVIDVHTMSGSRPVVLGTPEGRDELVRFWVSVAAKFRGNPNIFGYNLMNEPVSGDIESGGPLLNEQYTRLIRAIREVDPEMPIILDCDGAGRPEMLEYLEVFPYKNIIYSPHMYKPFELTHQLNRDQESYLAYPNPARGWNKDFLRQELAGVREFQLKTGARIYVGEFSCIRWAPGAENYLRDCIELFEEYGWDWSYHAFREWQGWSVECVGDPNHEEYSKNNPRREVLLEGFSKNRGKE